MLYKKYYNNECFKFTGKEMPVIVRFRNQYNI